MSPYRTGISIALIFHLLDGRDREVAPTGGIVHSRLNPYEKDVGARCPSY